MKWNHQHKNDEHQISSIPTKYKCRIILMIIVIRIVTLTFFGPDRGSITLEKIHPWIVYNNITISIFDDFWSIHTFPQQKTWGFPEWIQMVAGGMNIVQHHLFRWSPRTTVLTHTHIEWICVGCSMDIYCCCDVRWWLIIMVTIKMDILGYCNIYIYRL